MDESSPDLKFVAVIIWIAEDEYLEDKNYLKKRDLVLTVEERATLWREDLRLPEYAWVLGDSLCMRAYLEKAIEAATRRDRYDVRFVGFMGPDNHDMNDPRHGNNETLISDVVRKATSLDEMGVPKPASDFTP